MTKEKQIEEMARDIGWSRCTDCIAVDSCSECPAGVANECFFKEIAEYLCNKGYRKQSEWISVEERLPQVDTDVLVITANGSFKVARCNIYHIGTLVLLMTNDGLGERAITHWMPLPELTEESEGSENG